MMVPFPAQNHPKGQHQSAHPMTPGLCVQHDWLASEDRDPPRRGQHARARHPHGQDLPMGFATGHDRCPTYTPREPIKDAPALSLFSGRLGYGLHGRRNRRRTDAP
jgi:hypothetical protein